jgi:hypothetical protein
MSLTIHPVQRDGWQHQAKHLTVIHTLMGRVAMTVAEQLRRLSSFKQTTYDAYDAPAPQAEFERKFETDNAELANELERTRVRLDERDAALIRVKQLIEYLAERGAKLEQQVAQETPAPQTLEEEVEAPTKQSAVADKRTADLEAELATAREGFVLCQNESRSLQMSLNWIVSENVRLSRRVTELETLVDEANKKRQTETHTLNTYLEAMSTRALAAEKVLQEVRQSLLAGPKEKHAAERMVVDGTSARDTIDNKLQQFQNSLMIKLPAAPITPPSAKTDLVKIWKKIADLDVRLQSELEKHAIAAGSREKSWANCAEQRSELDNDVAHNGNDTGRAEVRHTQMLLANILAS